MRPSPFPFNLRDCRLALAAYRLAFRVWRLAFGVWRLAFGVWRLAFGVWRLAQRVLSIRAIIESHAALRTRPHLCGRGG
ncbi:hypothetical protein BHT10_04100 [Burkholderia pseudomallei]|nr:hypothetical protein BHT10_04100 [Burkholderia pseudomallei]MUU82485.1 hypothetical protein [Burkholderia pseudomallei]